jgi:tRNA(Ile)-lysidine synthase
MPLTMRKIQAGDRFVPYGMRCMKLISDYMADRKKNYFERQQQTVLCDADGEVVWLIGERVAQKAACNEKTIKVLSARYIYDE